MAKKKAPAAAPATVEQVHEAAEHVAPYILTPPHPPREETPIYEATHKRLAITEDRPCFICGVRRSDLQDAKRAADPTVNPFGAKDIETHHWPIERSLADAVDPERVARDYPSVRQFKTLIEWVDSEFNMLVLCDQCHRMAPHAIHGALYQTVIATKYAVVAPDGKRYVFAATKGAESAAIAQDEAVVQELGIDAQVAAEEAATAADASGSTPPNPAAKPARSKRSSGTRSRSRSPRKPTPKPTDANTASTANAAA